ncbi:MAG: ribonuclease Z [Methanobacteriota archaeon]|nr:MAG: ribonuclease Z [Euryarchaeota archaeon]
MRVVFLGTGGTYPSKKRNVSSVTTQIGPDVVMFDCGEGTQRQLTISPVSFMRIRAVFFTHLHADHFLGLPGLIQSMSLNGRTEALQVFGPDKTIETVRDMLNLGHFRSQFDVIAKELAPGENIDLGSFNVSVAEASHNVPSLAFAVEEEPRRGRFDIQRAKELGIPAGPKYRDLQEGRPVTVDGRTIQPQDVIGQERSGRKMVYSGDTRPCQSVTEMAAGADMLIHDGTLDSTHARLADEFGHSTAAQAAKVAKDAGVATLYLTHISPRYDDDSVLLAEARSVFPHSVVAHDLDVVEIRYRKPG